MKEELKYLIFLFLFLVTFMYFFNNMNKQIAFLIQRNTEEVKELRKRTDELENEMKNYIPLRHKKKIVLTSTGYCNSIICINVAAWRDGRTASGTLARRGTCAADWKVFPLKSEFYVPGYGKCIVEDRGSKIKGNHIDLFFNNYKEAKEWGKRKGVVYLLPRKDKV